MMDAYAVRRLRHRLRKYREMIDVLRILERREELHYGEAASLLGLSGSYAYNLLAMMSYMYRLPFRDGIMDNPGRRRLLEIAEDLRRRINVIGRKLGKTKKRGKRGKG